jgi:hypothetical protein
MGINYAHLRSLTAREISDTFPPKTLKTIIEAQARWTQADLKRLKLIA